MQMGEVSALISQRLKSMSETPNWSQDKFKSMALTVFFPYVVHQAQNGQHEMLDAFFNALRACWEPWSMWHCIEPLVPILLNVEGPVSKKQAVILASPHLPWWHCRDQHLVRLWVAAVSEVPYTNEICQSVVDTLLQIASNDQLQPHIPVGMWQWLNKHPTLPPVCAGRAYGSAPGVVKLVHGLGDAEILKSYLLLVWSELDCLYSQWMGYYGGLDYLSPVEIAHASRDPAVMCASIRQAFSGVGMGHHQKELLQKLDHILEQLDLGLDHLQQYKPSLMEQGVQLMKGQYGQLKEVLLEIGQEE